MASESLFQRLKNGLTKSREGWAEKLDGLFQTERAWDAQSLADLEEILWSADVGVKATQRLADSANLYIAGKSVRDLSAFLEREIVHILKEIRRAPAAAPLSTTPWVMLFLGVNGVGKTTTIGKMAAKFRRHFADRGCLADAVDAQKQHDPRRCGKRRCGGSAANLFQDVDDLALEKGREIPHAFSGDIKVRRIGQPLRRFDPHIGGPENLFQIGEALRVPGALGLKQTIELFRPALAAFRQAVFQALEQGLRCHKLNFYHPRGAATTKGESRSKTVSSC